MESSIIEMAQKTDRDIILLDSLYESYKTNSDNLDDLLEQIVNMLKKNKKSNALCDSKKVVKKPTVSNNTFNIIDVKVLSNKIILIINYETNEGLELDIENGDLNLYKNIINENSFDKVLLGINIKKVTI